MTRPRSRPLATLAVLAAASVVVGCGSAPPPAAGTASGSPAIRARDAALLPTTVDALPPADPGSYDDLLAQLRGTPIVVNFWASWCEPCVQEMPMLARAARANPRVQFLGVNVLDDRGAAEAFIARFDVPFPSLFDATGAIRTAVGGIGQPVTVFYAADGTVAAKVDGQLGGDTLTANLDAIAA